MRWIAAIFCFALAVLLLLCPDSDAARWIGRQINDVLAPNRFTPRLWESRAGIGFAVAGMFIAIFDWLFTRRA